jgi:two-component system response regulator
MNKKTILLVEDNEDDEIMTVRSLRNGGFQGEIVVVRDGQEATDWLLGEGEHAAGARSAPDVILLDIRLPKVSGFQVLETIRRNARTRHVPVVMLTASDEQADLVRSYDLHANSYVRKPVTLAEFQRALLSLGIYWTEFNRVPVQNWEC